MSREPSGQGQERLKLTTRISVCLAITGCPIAAFQAMQVQELLLVREFAMAGISLAMGALARLLGDFWGRFQS